MCAHAHICLNPLNQNPLAIVRLDIIRLRMKGFKAYIKPSFTYCKLLVMWLGAYGLDFLIHYYFSLKFLGHVKNFYES